MRRHRLDVARGSRVRPRMDRNTKRGSTPGVMAPWRWACPIMPANACKRSEGRCGSTRSRSWPPSLTTSCIQSDGNHGCCVALCTMRFTISARKPRAAAAGSWLASRATGTGAQTFPMTGNTRACTTAAISWSRLLK
ncbi:hypothetical protein G6F51_014242 [Rhizopus arrhizus]|uniref:Uncharacterized protein n=1 Tax=Rhizopus oryzae TaxID=64495 RepID=A0A9P6XNH8_RHIOR|nr:hypothetical protein G6F51_014242 [Rhizopus arrhizus]